jgi:hypothetical protein
VRGNIISYFEMCQREGSSLQRGMNFRLRGGHSVVLMSIRPGSPYEDRIEEDGTVLIYEGHDEPRSSSLRNPKAVDQPGTLPSGALSENGKFHNAAQAHKVAGKPPDIVRVYEKLKKGIWSDNGYFHLVDSWKESDGQRQVFKFKVGRGGCRAERHGRGGLSREPSKAKPHYSDSSQASRLEARPRPVR